ncbi:MAG TPA: TlpA disulfide reductase family protein [Bacteroidales bacterium]|nr:TlpA disulfide reductase family protein [Bacteroidales bacterium]
MKKLGYLFLIMVLGACSSTPENSFTINGTVSNLDSGMVYLQNYTDGSMKTIDSSAITNGNFKLAGSVDLPELYYIQINNNRRRVPFFAENSNITVNLNTDSLDKTVITGSKSQAVFDEYQKGSSSYNEKMQPYVDQYYAARAIKDETKMQQAEASIDSINTLQTEYAKKFVINHPNSVVAPYILNRELSYTMDAGELDSITSLFDTTLNNSVYTKDLKKHIAVLKSVEVGQPAPDFSMATPDGDSLSLSSLKGEYKYLLIDFWASWCPPCRAENPNVVAIYNDYHKKGFDVLGVSFDKKKEPWLKAIENDHLAWHHVSDLSYWNNAAGKLYGIRSIPSNVLLDSNGIIIAKNLRGDELRNKISGLLD